MKKYQVVFSIDPVLGVRFLTVWANSILQAVANAKRELSDLDNVQIIQCKQVSNF